MCECAPECGSAICLCLPRSVGVCVSGPVCKGVRVCAFLGLEVGICLPEPVCVEQARVWREHPHPESPAGPAAAGSPWAQQGAEWTLWGTVCVA